MVKMAVSAAAFGAALVCVAADSPCAYVDPFVGTSATGHTTPAACVPFGLVQAGPDTGNGDWHHCSGYRYDDRSIFGFSQTHLNGTGCADLGDVRLLPFTTAEAPESVPFDKSSEKASPGYYTAALGGVKVEVSATEHCAIYRIAYPADSGKRLLVDSKWCLYGWHRPKECGQSDEMKDDGRSAVFGKVTVDNWVRRTYAYKIVFDHPFASRRDGVFDFDLRPGEPLVVKVALSALGGVSDAEKNLAAEIPGWDFDGVSSAAREKWAKRLACVTVDGTEDQKKNFYTSLYHLFIQPNNIADHGQEPYYSTFSTWDTFRAAHPLYTIIAPETIPAFISSMSRQGRSTGYLPVWTLWGRDNQCMIGTHSIPVIVDAFLKEGEKAKGEKAKECWEGIYDQIKETLTKKHPGRRKENWDVYDRYGYYPFDIIRGESVSRTLECAYDDWCAGRMAEELGRKDDAEFFFRRSAGWKNVFDRSLGLVRGRDSNGRWREPFNPYALGHGGESANDFTEGNAFQYTWHVMQDPDGLVEALGGRESFVRKLDGLFSEPEKAEGQGEVVDVTGLIGQYVHGNEPSHHVIYFYTLVGENGKAAERIREVFDRFYLPKPDGLCGNDDCGQMSAWYVFSALGFYPFNPCGGEYVIGAPQIPKATIALPGGRTFTVVAKNLSRANKYVKSVTLNGRPVADWKIRHADIMSGGELVFEMAGVGAGLSGASDSRVSEGR